MYDNVPFAGGVIFAVIWLILMLGMLMGWVLLLIAVWRAMKAHESMARAFLSAAQDLKKISAKSS